MLGLTLVVDSKLCPGGDFQYLEDKSQEESGYVSDGEGNKFITSSNVPNPPGKPTNPDDRRAICTLRSCIESTTI